jgi:16S rRNA (guanine527-N7)-methyltransferase
MTDQARSLIERAAAETSTVLAEGAIDSLVMWIERIEEWNERMDLTAARSREELVDLMVVDAMVVARRVDVGARVVDVGTGAGAPGLALALIRPDLRLTLVEPSTKRGSFLRTVAGALGRRDIGIERARGESFSGRCVWDVAISRATMPPDAWLGLGTQLVEPTGAVWVLLGKGDVPVRSGWKVAEELVYEWPLTGVARRALAFRR